MSIPAEDAAPLRFADLTLDVHRRQAERGGRIVQLTRQEFELLSLLMRHPGEALSRATISERVWGFAYDGASNAIDVCIAYLRAKLEAAGSPRIIKTVRGVGYALSDEA